MVPYFAEVFTAAPPSAGEVNLAGQMVCIGLALNWPSQEAIGIGHRCQVQKSLTEVPRIEMGTCKLPRRCYVSGEI
jgi:hypothetical protein